MGNYSQNYKADFFKLCVLFKKFELYHLSLKLPKLYDSRIASVQPKHVWHSSIGVRLNLSKAHLWNGAITPMLIIYQHGELWLKLTMKLNARRTRMHTYSDIVLSK